MTKRKIDDIYEFDNDCAYFCFQCENNDKNHVCDTCKQVLCEHCIYTVGDEDDAIILCFSCHDNMRYCVVCQSKDSDGLCDGCDEYVCHNHLSITQIGEFCDECVNQYTD
jgi:hypothetical protein